MANIKFALKFDDGVMIHTIEELREKFDLKRALEYYVDGKLLQWLHAHYYTQEAEAVAALDRNAPDFQERLCSALSVPLTGNSMQELCEIQAVNEKRRKLKAFTDDEQILEQAAYAAFQQSEMVELLKQGAQTVYLCENTFTIPLDRERVTYIGLGHVVAMIPSEKLINFKKKHVRFQNIMDFVGANQKRIRKIPYTCTFCSTGWVDIDGKPHWLASPGWKSIWKEREGCFVACDGGGASLDTVGDIVHIALDASGKVHVMEGDAWGQQPEKLPSIKQIKFVPNLGCYGIVALDVQGELHCWGKYADDYLVQGYFGSLKKIDRSFTDLMFGQHSVFFAKKPEKMPKIKQICATSGNILALSEDGKIYIWGSDMDAMKVPDNLPKIQKAVLRNCCAVALGEDGKVYTWGNANYLPTIPNHLPIIIDIGSGDDALPLLDEDGNVHWIGDTSELKLGALPPLTCVFDQHYVGCDEDGVVWQADGTPFKVDDEVIHIAQPERLDDELWI